LKEELLNVDPKVALYHDVITDSEIAKIKELAIPRVCALCPEKKDPRHY